MNILNKEDLISDLKERYVGLLSLMNPKRKVVFNQIVSIIESHFTPPDVDELVEKIMWINKNFGGSPNAKLKIRKLLEAL